MKFINEEFNKVEGQMQSILFKVIINLLMYAMVDIRICLIYAISVVSHYMSKAKSIYYTIIKIIMRYLKDTLFFEL